eukprot:10675534-Prorocentrum_lima.AAC.1
MTSSLVGSEMCIRDRSGLVPPHVSRGEAGACRGGRSVVGRPVDKLAPVSYTHLTLPTICSV